MAKDVQIDERFTHINKQGRAKMVDVSEKKKNVREAIACGSIYLLGDESIDKLREKVSKELVPGIFAENITTEGITLYELPIGTKLSIGEVIMEVTQIGKECNKDCEIMKTTGECVMPREGIFARVLEEGWIESGDEISVIKYWKD